MSARTDLLDDDGENQAVRAFLLAYQGNPSITIGGMRHHLKMSGWDGCWTDWTAAAHKEAHLTKATAQLWIRHLLALEDCKDAADAIRYRWLRDQNITELIGSFTPYVVQGQTMRMLEGAEVDVAVDAAIKGVAK